jgi:hypothetical protein
LELDSSASAAKELVVNREGSIEQEPPTHPCEKAEQTRRETAAILHVSGALGSAGSAVSTICQRNDKRLEHEMNAQQMIAAAALAVVTSTAHAASRNDELRWLSEAAGVCAAYNDEMYASKQQSEAAWLKAPSLRVARYAAERWQIGYKYAEGTVKHSFVLEGQDACDYISSEGGRKR